MAVRFLFEPCQVSINLIRFSSGVNGEKFTSGRQAEEIYRPLKSLQYGSAKGNRAVPNQGFPRSGRLAA